MDISTKKNRPGSSAVILLSVLRIFNWLREFFTLTEEDRVKAGICDRRYGRNE